jgi:hypothetical protein
VPVLVLDVTSEEAAKLLLVIDALAEMAGADAGRLSALLKQVRTGNAAVQSVLDRLAEQWTSPAEAASKSQNWPDVAHAYQLVVDCGDEARQEELYERLTSEGFKCRVLTL